MKRIIFTFCIALFSASVLFAQVKQEQVNLEDFEDGKVNFDGLISFYFEGSLDTAIVENPVKDEVNPSEMVWRWKRGNIEESAAELGFWMAFNDFLPAGYERIEIKYMRTNEASQLFMTARNWYDTVLVVIDPVTPVSRVNEWDTLVFDLVGNGITNLHIWSLINDFNEGLADTTSAVYIDDITWLPVDTVIPPPTSNVLFADSEDDRFYDQSVVSQTAPSMVLAEPFEVGGAVADKLPVVTDPVHEGTNALQLQWTSAEGGDWMVMVGSVGWRSFNVTNVAYLNFWVNSTADLDTAALPMIFLESHTGQPKQTVRLRLSDYLDSSLVANTWTEVHVPLTDFWEADSMFVSSDVVKGVFFAQNEADNVEHTLYLDHFTFGNMTSVDRPLANKQIKAYYYNGELRIADYAGLVRVYDLVGRKVAEGNAFEGKMKLNLKNGIYIISTSKGNTKIALQ